MWRRISNLKKLTVKTIDKYIWGILFLLVYFGTIATAISLLSLI